MHVVRVTPKNGHTKNAALNSPVLRLWPFARSQIDWSNRANISPRNLQPYAASFTSGPDGENQNGNLVMSILASVWKAVDSQFLPIALALSLTAGYTLPEIALRADTANVSSLSTFVIFVISGAW